MNLVQRTAIVRCVLLLLCAGSAAADVMPIEPLDFAGDAALRAAWRVNDPAVALTMQPGPTAVIACRPAQVKTTDNRIYVDRDVKLDLGGHGLIRFTMDVDNPGAFAGGTLYFRSGDGWYAGHIPTSRTGPQRIVLQQNDFRTEGAPAGWHAIDGYRLSLWFADQAIDQPVTVRVGPIEAASARVVTVFNRQPTMRGHAEAQAITAANELLSGLLDRCGLTHMSIDQEQLPAGALRHAKLAILPYNPVMTDEQVQALAAFAQRGGKMMVFFSADRKLHRSLGIDALSFMREAYNGQFALIRFDRSWNGRLPETMRQDSWNIYEPTLSDAGRMVGQWLDASGEPTGKTAIVLGPDGMYMGHVLLQPDEPAKLRFMRAMLAELCPDLLPEMASSAVDRMGTVEGEDRLDDLPVDRALIEQTRHALNDQQYSDAIEMADRVHAQAVAAFEDGLSAWRPAFRGVWCHYAYGISGWSWDQTISTLQRNGFNAIVINQAWGGLAFYPSDVLPVSDMVADRGDAIAQCLAACRKYGVQMHVWKVNFNLSTAPPAFIERMQREGRTLVDRNGAPVAWLDPSHPENQRLEVESMLEIVRRYDVDGIHFDYIRWPGRDDINSGNALKARFAADTGVAIDDWPDDPRHGRFADAFNQWRCDQVTRIVADVARQAKRIRPTVQVSAAVFGDYPQCRVGVGQDWAAWAAAGDLDFICPMDYRADPQSFRMLVRRQLRQVAGRVPLYPGVGVTASGIALTPAGAAIQLLAAKDEGAPGFILFNYDNAVAQRHVPMLGRTLLSR